MLMQEKVTKPDQNVRQQVEELRMRFASSETRLMVGVMDECLYKMEVLSLLGLPDRVSLSLGEGAAACLAEHVHLCETYRSMRGLEPERTARGVQDSLLNVLRMVRPCGMTIHMEAPVETVSEDQRAVRELREGLGELRGIVSERLQTTGVEEQESRRRAQEVVTKYRRNVERIEELERKVAEEERDRDKEIRARDEEIRRLKVSLQEVEETTEDYITHKQREASKRSQKEQKKSEEKRCRLQQEADRLRAQLQELITEHRETRKEPRERKEKLEAEVENRVQIYDKAMGEEQPEYREIMEVRRRIQEQREEEEMKSHAAGVIQVFWRRWRVHKGVEKKGKPESVKGKKGKKGKGKKGK